MKSREPKRAFSRTSSASSAAGRRPRRASSGRGRARRRAAPTGWSVRCWKSAYAPRLRGHLGDVELVVDVAVEVEALGLDGVDRLARERERDRDVAQELAGTRVGDDGALVADDRIVETGLREVAGTDWNIRPVTTTTWMPASRAACERGARCGGAARRPRRSASGRGRSRRARRRAGTRVGGSAGGSAGRRDDVRGDVGDSLSESWPLNGGIAPAPFVTRCVASARSGFASSRFGPTLPVEPASFSVWQPVQPALRKIFFPSTGSPLTACVVEVVCASGSVPTTVSGTGFDLLAVHAPCEQESEEEHGRSSRSRL